MGTNKEEYMTEEDLLRRRLRLMLAKVKIDALEALQTAIEERGLAGLSPKEMSSSDIAACIKFAAETLFEDKLKKEEE